MPELRDKIKQLPYSPGCYLYKDRQGRIIYIGKSKSLRKRVAQYFTGFDKKEKKIQQLVKEIYDFDYILTETDIDALLLECELIKTHKPHFNAAMKRNKQRPYLCIDMKREYPGIFISLTARPDTVSFGCFYHQEDAEEILRLLSTIWKTPLCGKEYFIKGKQARPCLNHYMGKCEAPCQGVLESEEYRKQLRHMIRFLRGRDKTLIPGLRKEMLEYSAAMEFEKAALLHGRIVELEKLQRRAKKYQTNLEGRDYCVFIRAWKEPCFYLVYVQDGQALVKYRMELQPDIDPVFINNFITALFERGYNIRDSSMFTTCLVSIAADKLYLDITSAVRQKNRELLVKKIVRGYCEFANDK